LEQTGEIAVKPRRNYAKTRERLLLSAYRAFSEQGYAKTGIREIAKDAGVSSSLILKYFGSKSALFEEALIHAIYRNSLFARDKKSFGIIMAKLMASAGDGNLISMMTLALADPESRAVARKVLRRHIIEPIAEWLGPPDELVRAQHLYAVMAGFSMQMRDFALSGDIPPQSVKWLARALQDIVDNK
jgi:AcrR family transcriptional regulator